MKNMYETIILNLLKRINSLELEQECTYACEINDEELENQMNANPDKYDLIYDGKSIVDEKDTANFKILINKMMDIHDMTLDQVAYYTNTTTEHLAELGDR